jgi:hypothetical protein
MYVVDLRPDIASAVDLLSLLFLFWEMAYGGYF